MPSINWSGHTWDVRTWTGGPSKDGLWSGSNVWIDEAGRLHLKITRNADGKWISGEINSRQVGFGYGAYRIVTVGCLDTLPKGAVFGLFTYGNSPEQANWEIDLEASAWGLNEVAWDHTYFSVVEGKNTPNVLSRSPVRSSERFVHDLVWLPGGIVWRTTDDRGAVRETRVNHSDVQVPGKELFLMNLWVYNRNKMAECEVVVESFDFIPFRD